MLIMCGIVGYTGPKRAQPLLVEGLKRLEYRGYDSSGISLPDHEGFLRTRRVGGVDNLSKALAGQSHTATCGIGHTRWATHGGVTEANAHPHNSCDGMISLVHNGVVENHSQIKQFLLSKGYTFASETDSEVLANLIAYHYAKEPEGTDGRSRFFESVRKTLLHIQGTYGLAIMCRDCPGELVGARNGSPLIAAIEENEKWLVSDVAALAGHSRRVVYLNEGEMVLLRPGSHELGNIRAESLEAVIHTVEFQAAAAELGEYEHYMLKEIYEQPEALENAMRGRFSDDGSTAKFGGLNMTPAELRRVGRIIFCGCGTAWHACLLGEYLIERFGRIPVEVEYASEYRYRNAPHPNDSLLFVISQSGETIDTLAALQEAKRKGIRTLAITNGVGSTIARETEGGIYQYAGQEIGVASTKAFTSQVLLTAMLGLYFGRLRDMSYQDGCAMVTGLKQIPSLMRKVLGQVELIKTIARAYSHYNDMIFLGRYTMFPVALEGALKLKEISYIHAEGYPAAEMKHGPLALIGADCPCVFLVTDGEMFHKTLSNIQEVKARGAPVIVVAEESCRFPDNLVDHLITIPVSHEAVQPILATVPLQLFSYYVALERGCNVDKPRNLAKSVTVE
jgi:glucosamine--fructose-6-phosphate aminotransferase (isomerizing)